MAPPLPPPLRHFVTRLYDDGQNISWGVFVERDLAELRGTIRSGQAAPVLCGLTAEQAWQEAARRNRSRRITEGDHS